MILTRDEYKQILSEKTQAERDAANIKYQAERDIKQAQSDAQRQIQHTTAQAQKQIAEVQQALEEEQEESTYQRGLNENLLRISRERANADRKLRPKKEHTGYVVVSSKEKEWRYKESRNDWKTVTLWETTLQTPYTVDFTEEQARKQTKELTGGDGGKGDWMVSRIGIKNKKWQYVN